MFRIGHGYDLHRMIDGDFITLGGEKIYCNKTFVAHSDGDVLIHAIMDSLLGAAALGDIGEHFPDTDNSYKKIDSMILLNRVKILLDNSGFIINNIDATVLAEYPKLFSLKKKMSENIARCLGLNKTQVNVKATTQEGMGETKNKDAIAAHAVSLIERKGDI